MAYLKSNSLTFWVGNQALCDTLFIFREFGRGGASFRMIEDSRWEKLGGLGMLYILFISNHILRCLTSSRSPPTCIKNISTFYLRTRTSWLDIQMRLGSGINWVGISA
jgi:hypothetical protein